MSVPPSGVTKDHPGNLFSSSATTSCALLFSLFSSCVCWLFNISAYCIMSAGCSGLIFCSSGFGGFNCRPYTLSQSIPSKNGCSLISSASLCPAPSRFKGFLLSNYKMR